MSLESGTSSGWEAGKEGGEEWNVPPRLGG
jgi:hypothetical protein